jgi:ribosome-binding factor A
MKRRPSAGSAAHHSQTPRQRPLRVGEAVRHALVEVFARGHIRDPDLADVSLTISEVRMSPDLRQATTFVLPLGGGDNDTILKALKRAAPYLRGEVARLVELRHAPELRFIIDTSFDTAGRISTALAQPEVHRDLDSPPPAPPSTPPSGRRRRKGDGAKG